MSYRHTLGPFLCGDKDVTRRLGWLNLKPGEHYMAVRQAQGLKKGEKVQRLGECVCLHNYPEELRCIEYYSYRGWSSIPQIFRSTIRKETAREGFPELTPHQFVVMFCREMKCTPKTIVNRIEFARVIV